MLEILDKRNENEGRKTMQKENDEDNNLLGSTLTQITDELDDWQAMYLENDEDAFLITKIASEHRSPSDSKSSDNEGINAIEDLIVLEDDQLFRMMNEMTQIKINDTSINVYLYGVNDGDKQKQKQFVLQTGISPDPGDRRSALSFALVRPVLLASGLIAKRHIVGQ